MKPYVYEEIAADPKDAKTLQLEATPEGDILLRTTAGPGKGKSQKLAKLADAGLDPHIELLKKTFEDPATHGPALETQLNDAHAALKRPKVRWLKDAIPAPPHDENAPTPKVDHLSQEIDHLRKAAEGTKQPPTDGA